MSLTRLLERDLVAVTEHAAIAAAQTMGYGDADRSSEVASRAAFETLDQLKIAGRVRIGEGGSSGEGEPSDAGSRLFAGQRVGLLKDDEEQEKTDLAVLPLESAALCATGVPGSISAMVATDAGGVLQMPPVAQVEKIVVGPTAQGVVHLDAPVPENLRNIARAFGREVTDLTVVVLDHRRHRQLIGDIRLAGARVRLANSGELASAISAAVRGTGIHAVFGTGDATAAPFIAGAMRCLGGEIQARLVVDKSKENLTKLGISDPAKIFTTRDLVPGERIVFCSSGVTDGELLRGVRFFGGGRRTSSLFMSLSTGLIRFVDTIHRDDVGSPVHFH